MKKLLLKSMLLLCALVVGSMNGWADDVYEKVTSSSQVTVGSQIIFVCEGNNQAMTSSTNYPGVDVTISNSTITLGTSSTVCVMTVGGTAGAYTFTYGTNNQLSWLKNGLTINMTENNKNKWSIANDGSFTCNVESSVTDASTRTTVRHNVSGTTTNKFGCYTTSTGKAVCLYVKQTASNKVSTPLISGTTPFYQSTEVSISCSTADATIQYSTDDGANWTNYTAAFSINATTTVKAKATKTGLTDSDVATQTFTKVTPLANIAALTTAATASATDGYVTLSDAVVTYVNGSFAYIQDASGAVLYYKSGHGLTAGDVLNGTASVTYILQTGNPRITELSGVTPTAGVAPSPTSVDQSAWAYTFSDIISQYFEITNATITKTDSKYYVLLGEDNVQLYKYNAIADLSLTRTYTITGFPTMYNTTKELQIFADPVSNVPTITATPSSRSGFTYMEGYGPSDSKTITVSGTKLTANITITPSANYEVSLSDNSGYANSLVLTPTAGTVSATTVYVRLKAGLAEAAAYDGTITLSSDDADNVEVTLEGSVTEYVPDYTTLPFAWGGGTKGDLAALNGVTTSGLGDNYAEDKAPYRIKMDSQNDYIQIKTDAQPGKVSIGVKMLGGTTTSKIKVQESSDGLAFTDVEEFTISGTSTTIVHNFVTSIAFATTTRYVKIIKSVHGSNIGIGPINIAAIISEPSEPSGDPDAAVTLTTTANMAGWRTYNNNTANKYTVDGTTKVYYASATGENKVTLEEIAGGVPANTVVILHQTNGTNTMTLTKNDAATCVAPGSNQLKVSTENQNLGKVFRLGYKAAHGVGFYAYSSSVAPAGIIYVSAIAAGARDFLGFDFGDEATGVNEVKAQKVDGDYYNLAGQRVAQPTKGLYIVNGKKVIMK